MSHETEDPPLTSRPARRRRDAGALIAYILLALLYTWPLIQQSASGIADEPYDPILNASVLWWNATTIPFSHHWWNPPFFHPTQDVAAFTENLSGLSLVASPVYWLTHNPLTAYNLTFFLTWPLSAFTMYLFVASLTGRRDAGFLAGLAFAFTPYRMDELVHIQSLASFWLPLVLLGLHRFLEDRRARWLLMFAAAWLLESLTDGYYMFFGGVLVVLWLGYFCSRRDRWRAVPAIVMTWVLASVPLAPLMWEYHVVHERYGLRRTIAETIGFSARMKDWIHVSQFVWFWSAVLRDSDNRLFPGMTALILVMAGAIVTARGTSWRSLTARTRAALKRRSPLVFYVAATIVAAILCLGPVVRVGQHVILDPAPYRWLMIVPGFDQLRVPTRFWMIGILCLSAAAGLSFVKVAPAGAARAMPRAAGVLDCRRRRHAGRLAARVSNRDASDALARRRVARSESTDPRTAAWSGLGRGGHLSIDLASPSRDQRRQRLCSPRLCAAPRRPRESRSRDADGLGFARLIRRHRQRSRGSRWRLETVTPRMRQGPCS